MTKKIIITIDGPTGSGKSSTSRAVAKKLGYIHLDSGAIYRAVCLYFLNHNIKVNDLENIIKNLPKINIVFRKNNLIFLNDKDVTDNIRSPEINKNVAIYARVQEIRDFVTLISQKMIKESGVVLDGRDAGAVIAPQAELKIFLDANPKIRAERRLKDFGYVKNEKNIEKVLREVIIPKDSCDKDTLSVAKKQGFIVDTSKMTFEEQVDKIYKMALKKTK